MQTKLEAAAEAYKHAVEWHAKMQAEIRLADARAQESRNLEREAEAKLIAALNALLALSRGEAPTKAFFVAHPNGCKCGRCG